MTATDIEAKGATKAPSSQRTGTVIAVCYSKELINGVAKVPHDSGDIEQWGIREDRHYGETRIDSKGKVVPNLRTITVVAAEATRSAGATPAEVARFIEDIPGNCICATNRPCTIAGG